ncbi:redoxin domain-containing protein [Pedobacter sp. LMG 31464]|uniref:Redoxin domain-containing protein n=2 Tax=Pedobacter planticolens TaxID=2679964 RepID=A0A923E083_9SPHI|nr:redoxin domain-containing protein [Pedobacter planticolens]
MTSFKQKLTRKNIFNSIFIALLLLVLFVPSAKALMLQGLMEIGLFKPSLTSKTSTTTTDLAAIKFKTAKGEIVSLADLQGKVIFLNFWATWCPPCLAEIPSVNKLYEQYKNDPEVVFLLVDADSDFPKAQAYMDRKKYKLPVYNFASNLPESIFKGSLPTTIVFDKKGRVSFNGEGAANYSSPKFITFINQLKELKN